MAIQQDVFFVDDELVERLMRGDGPAEPTKAKRPAGSAALARAVEFASEGRIDDAVAELEQAAERGESTADILSSLAHLYFEKESWEQAAAAYRKVLEGEPSHRTAHYNLALCQERMGALEEAAREFETAASIDGGSWQAPLGRGFCLLKLARPEDALACFDTALERSGRSEKSVNRDRILTGRAVALQQTGRMDEAADLYKQLLPANPDSPALLSNFIAVSLARKDDAPIKELAERLLRVQPDAPLALQGLTAAAISRGDYSAAAQYCAQLVKVAPDSYVGWFNLGIAYQKTGRWEQAGNAYKEAALIRPSAVEASANLGAVLQERGDLAGARRAYERVLAVSPQLPGALWNLALLAEREGREDEAESLYRRLVAVHADWEDAALRLGFLELKKGKYADAVQNFQMCLHKQPNWLEALLNLGLAHWKNGDLQSAAATYEKILSLNPNQADASRADTNHADTSHTDTNRADALRALTALAIERNDAADALVWHERFLACGGRSAELAFNLGLLLQSSADPEHAAQCYRAALEVKPDLAEALLNLGHALKTSGQEQEARQAWSKAVEASPDQASTYFPQ
jgi:tetratricopeptide (TPR) repeat protein